ncbi:hypothetical protein B7P43_G03367 [Cryptotermes secundus]|uniref:Uncharacterized protein n=1 Tax=Cryptotermes secundus TaxID=105785 RepID=A0A2J7QDN7_9NEOP|nr:hypothetical protein B7P43_G03367 [Cryptotermes secundus]
MGFTLKLPYILWYQLEKRLYAYQNVSGHGGKGETLACREKGTASPVLCQLLY